MDPRASVLVVDDDDDIREILTMVLRSRGYSVASASDGVRALEYLEQSSPPDLMLLDLRMPRMAGDDVVYAVRESLVFPDLPIVVLSGDSTARQRASELPVQGCLVKPVELEELITTVRRYAVAEPPTSLGPRMR